MNANRYMRGSLRTADRSNMDRLKLECALILLDKVHWLIPVCFDDIWSEYHADV